MNLEIQVNFYTLLRFNRKAYKKVEHGVVIQIAFVQHIVTGKQNLGALTAHMCPIIMIRKVIGTIN